MAEKEALNFYKLSTLLVDKVTGVFSKRIQLECNNNLESFEDFLNRTKNKDDLFHMWRSVRCCNPHCNKSKTKKLLYDVQWNQLYSNTSAIHAGHVKRDPRGLVCQECTCVYNAHSGIVTDSLDVTLASCILLNLCSLSPTEKTSIENLRGMRNSVFAHAQNATISDTNFQMHWTTIENDVISLSSLFNSVTQNEIKDGLDTLHQIPFVDKNTLQALVNNVRHQQGKDTCISEKLEEIAGCENCILQKLGELEDGYSSCLDGSSQHKVQKITTAEAEISDFIPTKGLEKGITSLKTNGAAIFTGVCGCGKSTNSIEILRRVKVGEIFQESHCIQHINIDNWDSQVDIDKNTVVFLEDPLGTTNANTALTEHDNGTFRKLWACVQKGKVKVIMTVRSNILYQSKTFLKRHKIFDDKYVINLSEGDYALDNEEKGRIVQLFLDKYNVSVEQGNVQALDDINVNGDSLMKVNIDQKVIKQILESDPPMGFPLCCKQFFESPRNISLGARYFSQPSKFMLEEIQKMALSENPVERTQFAILVYMLVNKGVIDISNIDMESMNGIVRVLNIREMKPIEIRISLNALNNRFVSKCNRLGNVYKFVHVTVLESVFIKAIEDIPELISILLTNVDTNIIYELVKTQTCKRKDNEVVVKIHEDNYQALADRFVKELREKRFRQVVAHPSMTDTAFTAVFFPKLKQCQKIFDEGDDEGLTFFSIACLFDKAELVENLIHAGFICSGIIREGGLICIEFNNTSTFKILMPNMTPENLREAFTKSSRHGKEEMVKLIIANAHEDLLPEDLQRGFVFACGFGDLKLVKDILSCDIEQGFHKGLEEACKKGHIHIVKYLLHECRGLTNDQLVTGFVKSCEHGHVDVGMSILSAIPPTYYHNKALLKSLRCCSRKTFTSLVKDESAFSNENIGKCLLEICECDNDFSSNALSKDLTFSVSGESSTPFPLSIHTQSCSVPIQTPATESINLFPGCSFHNSNFRKQSLDSEKQVKALLIKSILELRTNIPKQYIKEVCIKAGNLGLFEIVHVIISAIFHTDLQTNNIIDVLVQGFENGHPDAFDFISFKNILPLVDSTDILFAVCKKDNVAMLQQMMDSVQLNIGYVDILNIACEVESLKIIKFVVKTNKISKNMIIEVAAKASEEGNSNILQAIIETKPSLFSKHSGHFLIAASLHGHVSILSYLTNTFPDMSLQDVNIAWMEIAVRSHVKSAKVLLNNRPDIPTEHIISSLYFAFCNNKTEFICQILSQRVDLPSEEIFELAKLAHQQNKFEIFRLIIEEKYEFAFPDIMALLSEVIEADDFNSFEILARKYTSVILLEIGKLLTTDFKTKYDLNIIEIFSVIHSELTKDEIESLLLKGFENRIRIEKISKMLIDVIMKNDTNGLKTIINGNPELSSKGLVNALSVACSYKECNFEILMKLSTMLTINEVYSVFLKTLKCGTLENMKTMLKFSSRLSDRQICSGLSLNLHRHNSCIVKSLLDMRQNLSKYHLNCIFLTALELELFDICGIILKEEKLSAEDVKYGIQFVFPTFDYDINHYQDMPLTQSISLKRSEKISEKMYICLLKCASVGTVFDKSLIEMFVKALPSPLTTDQIHQGLLQLCSLSADDSTMRMLIQLLPSPLTNNKIVQCLLQLCSINAKKSTIEVFTKLLTSPPTTDQIHQCVLQFCKGNEPDKSIIEMFVQLLPSPLTTDQTHQCLLSLCEQSKLDNSIIEMFIELLPSSLTTDHIHTCLLQLCLLPADSSKIKLFVKLLVLPLTTDQIYQCLVSLCKAYKRDKSIIKLFVDLLPSTLTADQIHQCLLPLCSEDEPDKSVIKIFIRLLPLPLTAFQITNHVVQLCSFHTDVSTKDMILPLESTRLSTDQVLQCLIRLCTHHDPDKSIIEMLVQLLQSPVTTKQIRQSLLPLCSQDEAHRSMFEIFVQSLQLGLTTDQIHMCLLQLCSFSTDKSIIELFIQLLPSPMTVDQIHQCFSRLQSHSTVSSTTKMFLQSLQLTTDQIHQCLIQICEGYKPDKSIIEMFVQLLSSPLTTDQIYQCLLQICEKDTPQYKPDNSIIELFVQLLPSPLTTDQIHQCLLSLCKECEPDKSIIELFVQLLPSPLTTDQIHQCLLQLCKECEPDKSIIEMFVQLLLSPLTTDQIHQCLLTLCEEDGLDEHEIDFKSIIEMFVQLLPSPLTTDQIHQCLLPVCKRLKPDKSIIEMFIQLLPSPLAADQIHQCLSRLHSHSTVRSTPKMFLHSLQLTSDQIHQCLLQICGKDQPQCEPGKSVIETFIQLLPSPLTTDQIHQCLSLLCKGDEPDKSIIEIFVQLLPPPLTTDQIHQFLLSLCKGYEPVKSIVTVIEIFVQLLPSPLTSDQIHQCLLPLCEEKYSDEYLMVYTPDEAIIAMFVQLLLSPLTTYQIHQCLLPLCEGDKPDKSITEIFVQLLPSPLTTDQIHQCLVPLCKGYEPDKSIIEIFVQLLLSPLTTDQIHQCLLPLCGERYSDEYDIAYTPDEAIIAMFVQLLPSPLTTDQIHQCLLPLCKGDEPDKSIIEIFVQLLPSPLTTDQIHQCLSLLCKGDEPDKSIIEIFVQLLPPPLTTDQIHQFLLSLCKGYELVKSIVTVIEIFVQLLPSPLTSDQIHQCLLLLCKGYEPIKSIVIIEIFVQLLPSPLTTDQIHQCLLPLCEEKYSDEYLMVYTPDEAIIAMFVQLLLSPLTTYQIHQCLLPLCEGDKPDKSITEIFVQLLPSPLTTDQIHQCLVPLCKGYEPDKSIIEIFVQLLLSPLTTDQIHQCLLPLCGERYSDEYDIAYTPDEAIIAMFVQLLPSPLTTDQIHQCLLPLCKECEPDKSIIELFVQLLPSPLTTDQIHQCLLPLCKDYKPDKSMIEMFVQLLPSPLTTDQIHQCLLPLCSKNKSDKFIIEMLVQLLPSPLTTDQIHQCLLPLCTRGTPDKSIIEMLIQLLPSPLTTDEILQCLLKLLSSNNPDKCSVEMFLQKGKDLTTDQIYECLTKYVKISISFISSNLNPTIIETILTQRPDLTIEMVIQSVLTLLENVWSITYHFDKCCTIIDIILKIRPELTLKEIRTLYDALYKSLKLEKHSDRNITLNSTIARTRPDFVSYINGS